MSAQKISINRLAYNLVKRLSDHADECKVIFKKMDSGATLIDAGIMAQGGYLAGQIITEICLGALGKAEIIYKQYKDLELPSILVYTDYPLISTLGSQFAGWQIKSGK